MGWIQERVDLKMPGKAGWDKAVFTMVDETSYERVTWKTLEHEIFFKLMSALFGVKLESFPISRAELDNTRAKLGNLFFASSQLRYLTERFVDWIYR